jgi:hypothetical protein
LRVVSAVCLDSGSSLWLQFAADVLRSTGSMYATAVWDTAVRLGKKRSINSSS